MGWNLGIFDDFYLLVNIYKKWRKEPQIKKTGKLIVSTGPFSITSCNKLPEGILWHLMDIPWSYVCIAGRIPWPWNYPWFYSKSRWWSTESGGIRPNMLWKVVMWCPPVIKHGNGQYTIYRWFSYWKLNFQWISNCQIAGGWTQGSQEPQSRHLSGWYTLW